jgi:hypothetical protein
MIFQRPSDSLAENLTIDGQRSAGRDGAGLSFAHQQRAEAPRFRQQDP